ncbi:MAG: nicotinate-nucleotide adenylyltransferase [Dinoroseobacter sp.]|nr:nicotinate-nucleotide adenylyltransferase [Dinoroseobacter sp.]MDJ0993091.1 nicotinate-nucleotide adenylyltransferase [Dinoroseobacter sp.]
MKRTGWPIARPGQSIGLLGGSFDPAHEGHVHITREALKRFGLDRVWWLVTPGNPLKARQPAPLSRRLAAARDLMWHPRVEVTQLEAQLGTLYTAETLEALREAYPGVRFVWLMGADNLASFHQWDRWKSILGTVPVGVFARPDAAIAALTSPAARCFAGARLRGQNIRGLGRATAPAWAYVTIPLINESSSAIRAAGRW